jgi:type VII secretion integral membrane protein EccD
MTDTACSVTVVGSRRRLDVSLPGSLPVVEVMGDLVEMLAEPEALPAPAQWGLVRVGGSVLDGERGLAEQGVADGSMLFLRDLTDPPPAPAVEDYAEAVALAVEARAGRWTPSVRQSVLVAASAAWALLGAALARGVTDPAARAATSLGAAVLLLAAGVVIGRRLHQPIAGAVTALSGLPFWAVGGLTSALLVGLGGVELVPATAGFVAAGGLLALLAGTRVVGPVTAALVSGLGIPAGVAAICLALGADALQAAAVLAPLALIEVRLAPAAAVRLSRLGNAGAASQAQLGARVDGGHGLLAALVLGAALAMSAACTYLALFGGWYERGLAAAIAIAAACHARHFRFAAEAAPLAAAALVGLGALELAALRGLSADPGLRPAVVGLTLLTAFVLLGAGIAGRRRELSPLLRRRLDQLEAVAVAAAIPLAAGALGLYSLVASLAQRLA